jgi:hypothetical protein
MIRYLFFFVILFFLSCSDEVDVPEGVLPPEKMKAVLWDALLANEWVDQTPMTDSAFKPLDQQIEKYQQIFAFHKIDKSTFKKSISYYQSRPDLMKPILDSLQSRTERKLRK